LEQGWNEQIIYRKPPEACNLSPRGLIANCVRTAANVSTAAKAVEVKLNLVNTKVMGFNRSV
jgi:hypothetical protein